MFLSRESKMHFWKCYIKFYLNLNRIKFVLLFSKGNNTMSYLARKMDWCLLLHWLLWDIVNTTRMDIKHKEIIRISLYTVLISERKYIRQSDMVYNLSVVSSAGLPVADRRLLNDYLASSCVRWVITYRLWGLQLQYNYHVSTKIRSYSTRAVRLHSTAFHPQFWNATIKYGTGASIGQTFSPLYTTWTKIAVDVACLFMSSNRKYYPKHNGYLSCHCTSVLTKRFWVWS